MRNLWEKLRNLFLSPEEENHAENSNKRSQSILFFVSLFMVILMVVMFWNSAIIESLNPKATTYKEQAIASADANTIAPGDIYDRNDVLLVTTKSVGEPSVYADDYAYTQVIGYSGSKVTYYNADGEFEQRQLEYRLMEYYDNDKNYLYQTADIEGKKGCSLTLTLDHNLQIKVAELLEAEVGRDNRGSAIVMNVKTGEILAMVSYPTFNANDLQNSLVELQSVPEEKEVYYPITHKGLEVPGSIFKVVTSVALIDNGYEDLLVQDTNFTVAGKDIVNSYTSPNDMISYKEALNRSSNVFFAQAGLILGADALEETAKKFLIGETLELDFGTVASYWKIDSNNLANVADTSYGQGETLLSTMYAAMITQTIANDGIMLKPYIVAEVKNADGDVLQEGSIEMLSEVTSKSTADKIRDAMLATTISHLQVVPDSENRAIYEKYSIASKTGTAEIGEDDIYNAWYISFAPADDPQYVVVVNQCDTVKYGKDLMDTAAGIYEYLFEN